MSYSTINQIIKQIDSFATYHEFIKSFGVGRIWDFATSGDTKYPSLWVDYGNTTLNNVDGYGSEQITVLRIYISDRLKKGGGNETEVRSDTKEICCDLVAYLSNSNVFNWQINSTITLNAFGDESQDDELAGYWLDLNFRQAFEKDRCAIPFSTDPTPDGSQDYVVTILDQDGNTVTTLTAPATYTITLLTGINGGTSSSTYSNSIVGGLST